MGGGGGGGGEDWGLDYLMASSSKASRVRVDNRLDFSI